MATKPKKLTSLELKELTVQMNHDCQRILHGLDVYGYQAKMVDATTIEIKGDSDKLVFRYGPYLGPNNIHAHNNFSNTVAYIVSLLEARQNYINATGKDLLSEHGAYDALKKSIAVDKFQKLYLNSVDESGEIVFKGISDDRLDVYVDTYRHALDAVNRSNNKDAVANFHFTKLFASLPPGTDMTRMTTHHTPGFVTIGSVSETSVGLQLTTTFSLVTDQYMFDAFSEVAEDLSDCTLVLHHHEQALTWAELEATGGITETAYREEVKTCSPYQACFNLYDQQVYVENPFFEAFEFELSRNKTTLLKGMLENELIYEDWYRQYRIDGSRVAASLTMDDAGISLEPVFNGEGFDAFGAPPSKDFSNAGDASLTWAELEHTFGITKALYEAAKLLEEDNLYALKAAYAARGVSAESYAVDFSEP
jgi:hypothetical protein